jgi:xylulokinase
MLPFYRPEISPRMDATAPLLRGDAAFERWEQPAVAIRACVEGQFLNMQRCTDWMRLSPEVIYLTGGASKNDAIAQVVADVFQVRVERLAVSGSVALGAALRAASQTGGRLLEELEAIFCQPEANSILRPQVGLDIYELNMERLAALQAGS